MMRTWLLLALIAVVASVPAGAASEPHAGGVQPVNVQSGSVVDSIVIHVRMEAVITSDDDGSNASGILTLRQLNEWIATENESLRVSHANIVIDFDSKTDLAHVRNTAINHLAHNNDRVASTYAAQYPGKMVVFFRAYGPAGTGIGVTGNGYTAYNTYNPKGSPGCVNVSSGGCSASYTVMPSVYCGTTVVTDLVVDASKPGPLGPDRSGCGITSTTWYTYQNFNQLAHEVGHYLGLPHTFPGSYDFLSTPTALKGWWDGPPRSGTTRSILIYDGDSPKGPLISDGTNLMSGWSFTVNDTPADNGAHLFTDNNISMCHPPKDKTLTDSSGAYLVFNGATYTFHTVFGGRRVALTFKPDKSDVMSYFLCSRPMTFTPGQVHTMRTVLMTDPQRSYLLCTNAQDAALRPYMDCAGNRPPSNPYPRPRVGPTRAPNQPPTLY